MHLNSIVQVSAGQVSCDLGGEAAILNLKSGTYYSLNPVGARIWRLLTARRTIAEIRDFILAEYRVDAAAGERDVIGLLQELQTAGLIEVHAAQIA